MVAVLMVAGVTAVISNQHAYGLVTPHGESGFAAHLLQFTVDGLIWPASMLLMLLIRQQAPTGGSANP